MKKIVLLTMGLGLSASATFAAGYKVGLQGAKQIGMAHVGTGLALDASSIFFNPGSLAWSPNQINLAGTALMPRIQFLDKATQVTTDANPATSTPFSLYGSYGINRRLVAGLGVYTPFGSSLSYPNGWTGDYVMRKISLRAIFVQPTLSYKITENLGIGAGIIYSTGGVVLQRAIPISTGTANTPYSNLSAKANGMGYNLGLFFKKDKLSAGLNYRSRVNMDAEGDATFSNIPTSVLSSFKNTRFTSSLPLPAELNLGLGYAVNRKFTLGLDMNYAFWSAYDSLRFDFVDNTTAVLDQASPRLFKNAVAVRLGGQYAVNKLLTTRAGVFYDQTPSQDGYVTPETPDNNRTGATLGASYKLGKALSMDAAFLYQNVAPRFQKNLESGLEGTFATKATGFTVGLNYNFGAGNKATVNNPKKKKK